MKMEKFETIDEYIASFNGDIQDILKKFRESIQTKAPQATESMSYGMPTFKLNGKNLVHFAAFKNHIGFFPAPSGIDALADEAKPYRTGKGTMQFQFNQPIPWDLILRIVDFRVKENEEINKK